MRTGILVWATPVIAIAIALSAAVGAAADRAGTATTRAVAQPSNHVPPEVGGLLREGEVVFALPGLWYGGGAMRFTNRWERCDSERCIPTSGRVSFATRLLTADVGRRIRTAVTAANAAGTVTALSAQSGLVKPKLQPIDPFPVVALRGLVTGRGVYVTRLAARAPTGALLQVACKGRGCPFRRSTARFRRGFIAVRSMHRRLLPAGTAFSLRITNGENRIGKYTRFRVRSGRNPARTDRCLNPDAVRPMACERWDT